MNRSRQKIHLIELPCPRCGAVNYSTHRPLHADTATWAKYRGICNACLKPGEEEAMLREIAEAIVGR